jgi:FAD-dependent urate hydroxylase
MRVAVVGGGLGGTAAAVALRKVGAEVEVFEASPEPRLEGQSLSLLMNGTAAYAALGVGEVPGHRITKVAFLDHRSGQRLMTVDAGALEHRLGHPYVVVPRSDLLEPLLGALDGAVSYGKRASMVTNTDAGAEVHFADGSRTSADLVVIADGARSGLRQSLWPDDQGELFSFAFQGTVALPSDYPSSDEARLSVGPGIFTGAFPTTAGRIGWFIDQRADSSGRPPTPTRDYLLDRFASWPGGFASLIEATPAEEVEKEVYPIYIRRPRHTWGVGRIALLGDAAHSLNPALGQGTNQAFTDAVVLADTLRRAGSANGVLATYSRRRRLRTTAYWRLARWMLSPTFSRMSDYSARWTSDDAATRSWTLLTRVDPTVRRVLRSASGAER